MKFTLGFSPCPNDTFIFDAMVNGKIDTRGIDFDYCLEDVENLNFWAGKGKLDITKLSYNTFLHTVNHYALLHSGSALGKGVGPLLVAKKNVENIDINQLKIAIPGFNTTANLLLTMAYPGTVNKTEMKFDEIEEAVITGNYDAGLIIHEGRFTYQKKGLFKIIDLGEWWEQTMNALIPLGGIVIRRTIDKQICKTIDEIIKESINYAWRRYPQLSEFVITNAQEMEAEVMRKHIQLYVNEFTTDLGIEGTNAIQTLFSKAKETGIIVENFEGSIFY